MASKSNDIGDGIYTALKYLTPKHKQGNIGINMPALITGGDYDELLGWLRIPHTQIIIVPPPDTDLFDVREVDKVDALARLSTRWRDDGLRYNRVYLCLYWFGSHPPEKIKAAHDIWIDIEDVNARVGKKWYFTTTDNRTAR